MKYLLFTLEYPPFKGGVGHYYKNLVENWPGKNIQVLADSGDSESGVITKKLTQKYIYPHWLPAIWHLGRAVKKHKVNYVLVGHVLPLGTVAWLLSFILRFCSSLLGLPLWYALIFCLLSSVGTIYPAMF